MNGWRPLYGRITETIAVTEEEDGFNVAPMGVIQEDVGVERVDDGGGEGAGGDDGGGYGQASSEDGGTEGSRTDDAVHARLWRGSDTLENVRRSGKVTLNFVRDPVVYVDGAIGDAVERVVDGRLEDADAWIRCDAEFDGEERDGEVERWRLRRLETVVERERVFAVNRGFNAVVEASVDASRLGFEPELADRIQRNIDLARKCGGEREIRAAGLLQSFLDQNKD